MRWTLLALTYACQPAKIEDDSATPADDTGDDTGAPDSGDSGDSGALDVDCPTASAGLQQITTTPASPYFVVHPTAEASAISGHVVVFLAGGPGDEGSARIAWDGFLDGAEAVSQFWSVLPYSPEGDLPSEGERIVAALDEVLACYGGDRSLVHLAGTSNGGRGAFSLMLDAPERFRTLLGAPGYFQDNDTSLWATALDGKAVFNGVGELDESWQDAVYETHTTLEGLGIESIYEEFAGQNHSPDADFPQETLFEFWTAHGS